MSHQVGAFFDVDRTLVSCNTGRLFLKDLRRRGEISFFRALRALGWMAKYHLSLIDLQWVAARVASQMAGWVERDFADRCRRWVENEVLPLIMPGARGRIDRHRADGHVLAILSSSPTYVTSPIAEALNIEEVISTRFEVADGLFTGRLVAPACVGPGKVHWAEDLGARRQLDLERELVLHRFVHRLADAGTGRQPGRREPRSAVAPGRQAARLAGARLEIPVVCSGAARVSVYSAPWYTPAVQRILDLALEEDVGRGDATTASVIDETQEAEADIVVRERAVVCGLGVVEAVFTRFDWRTRLRMKVADGDPVQPGTVVASVRGPAAALLAGERTALNFLQHLSGIATVTQAFVAAAEGAKVRVTDTRKTTPGVAIAGKVRRPDRRRGQPPVGPRIGHPHQGQPHRAGRLGARGRPAGARHCAAHAARRRARSTIWPSWTKRWRRAPKACCWTTSSSATWPTPFSASASGGRRR